MNDSEIERVWQEFWMPIVAPDGIVDMEQVKKELSDFHMVMHEVALVYDHISGGLITKGNTHARHVIAAADDQTNRLIDEALEEYRR